MYSDFQDGMLGEMNGNGPERGGQERAVGRGGLVRIHVQMFHSEAC